MRITPDPFANQLQPLSASPAQQNSTRSLLGWTFTRPSDSYFTPIEHPGYWALHLAESARLVYSDKGPVESRLNANSCTNFQWFNSGSTQAAGYLHENHACLVFRGTQEKEIEDWGCRRYLHPLRLTWPPPRVSPRLESGRARCRRLAPDPATPLRPRHCRPFPGRSSRHPLCL
jgi:hypothetical protein